MEFRVLTTIRPNWVIEQNAIPYWYLVHCAADNFTRIYKCVGRKTEWRLDLCNPLSAVVDRTQLYFDTYAEAKAVMDLNAAVEEA